MGVVKEIRPHFQECARKLYEETDMPLHAIARLAGVSTRTLRYRAEAWGWRLRGAIVADGEDAAESAPEDVAGLVARIRTTVQREIGVAERNLMRTGPRSARIEESEKTARTLASLTKTLNELKRLEADGTAHVPKADDEQIDIDEFRNEIARRLEALCAEEQGE